jgi:hypothetical protein
MLTLKEFTDICRGHEQNPSLRVGQAMIIALFHINPILYSEMVGTALDPFYDDEKVDNFLAWIHGKVEV